MTHGLAFVLGMLTAALLALVWMVCVLAMDKGEPKPPAYRYGPKR